MSVDTNTRRRRNLDAYQREQQGDIELLLAPGIADYADRVDLSLSKFLLFRNLKATIALPNGVTLGRRASLV